MTLGKPVLCKQYKGLILLSHPFLSKDENVIVFKTKREILL